MTKKPNESRSYLGQLPWLTCALAAIAVLAQTDASFSDYLAYDRAAIQAGEIWRLVTGHFTHWSVDHLLWDEMMFATLGAIVEGRNRAGFIVTLVVSTMAISAVLWFCHPTIDQYRGLSGIDSALFTHAALMLSRDARRTGHPMIYYLISLSVVGFAAKIVYELVSGTAFFVDSSSFTPLPGVHIIGGLIGALGGGAIVCRAHMPPFCNYASYTARRCATTSRISS